MKIKAMMFDLDDTLIQTNSIFIRIIGNTLKMMSKELCISIDVIKEAFSRAEYQAHDEMNVNPKLLWPRVFEILGNEIKISEEQKRKYIDSISQIYTIAPRLTKNAEKILEALSQRGIQMIIVTHASYDWTMLKLRTKKIDKYFTFVEAVNVDEQKSSIHWEIAAKKIGIPKKYIAAIGDNVKGDIWSCFNIGIRNLFWYNTKNGWSKYTSGILPKGTVTIDDLIEILDYI